MLKQSPAAGQGCLTLFALPFAGIGTFIGIMLLNTLWTFAAAQQWQPVPARILTVELQTQRSDKSTTYETRASYQYEFDGQTYVGKRVGLQGGGDNVGNWQQQVHGELRTYRDSNRPFPAFVNPANPKQAVLYRQIRWDQSGLLAVFALTFGGAGYGLIVASYIGRKRLQRENALRTHYPDLGDRS